MSQKPSVAWRSLQPKNNDLTRCAREIKRLLQLKNEAASFTSLDLARVLKRSYVFTVWRVLVPDETEVRAQKPRPQLEWFALAAVLFVRRSKDDDLLHEAEMQEATVTLAYSDSEALLPHDEASPLLFGLGLILQNASFLQRTREPPFSLSQLTRLRIPASILASYPVIEEHYGDEMKDLAGDFVYRVSAKTQAAKF